MPRHVLRRSYLPQCEYSLHRQNFCGMPKGEPWQLFPSPLRGVVLSRLLIAQWQPEIHSSYALLLPQVVQVDTNKTSFFRVLLPLQTCSGVRTKMSLANRKVDGMPTFLKKVSLFCKKLYHILIF